MITIGIDNGTTGSIGKLGGCFGPRFIPMPTKKVLHYTKKGAWIHRVDVARVFKEIKSIYDTDVSVFIERPFTSSDTRFLKTVMLAQRAYEATIIALELAELGYETIDSKVWQKKLLSGIKGSSNLKRASTSKGIQLYPKLEQKIKSQGDADGLLIAHYYHEKNQNT
jgi:hypothetical protein